MMTSYPLLMAFLTIRLKASSAMKSKFFNFDGRRVCTAKETSLKNKPHLVTLHENILVSLCTFQPTFIHKQIFGYFLTTRKCQKSESKLMSLRISADLNILKDTKVAVLLGVTPEHQKCKLHHKIDMESFLVATKCWNGPQWLSVAASTYKKLFNPAELRMCTRGTSGSQKFV